MKNLLIVLLSVIGCELYSQDLIHSKSKFIEDFLLSEINETLIFTDDKEKLKLKLDSILIVYDGEEYVDEFGVVSKTNYKYITNNTEICGLYNVKYILPCFSNLKNRKKIVVSIIDDTTINGYFDVEIKNNYKSNNGDDELNFIIFHY